MDSFGLRVAEQREAARDHFTVQHVGVEATEFVGEAVAEVAARQRDVVRRLAGLVEAWRDPAAWAGEATVGGVTLPAELTAAVVADELVVHGWDLARGTGQPYRPDPVLVRAALEFAERFADLEGGPFGPSVAVPADAPPFDRLLGATGRDRNWTPGG